MLIGPRDQLDTGRGHWSPLTKRFWQYYGPSYHSDLTLKLLGLRDTDHESHKSLITMKDSSGMHFRWRVRVSEIYFDKMITSSLKIMQETYWRDLVQAESRETHLATILRSGTLGINARRKLG